jgi:hypothetical protein
MILRHYPRNKCQRFRLYFIYLLYNNFNLLITGSRKSAVLLKHVETMRCGGGGGGGSSGGRTKSHVKKSLLN